MTTKRWILTAVALAMVTPLLGVNVVGANTAGTEHLPDLQTLEPSDLRIESSGTKKLLRFSNTVVNFGDGPLELRPEHLLPSLLSVLSDSGTTRAYQVIYTHDASGQWSKVREELAGTFKFHPTHNHWHFEKFAKYELFALRSDGSRKSINRVGEKTTFCMIDTVSVNMELHHSGPRRYTQCGQRDTMGITVGWGDKYSYWLDGQWVDVSNLPDGDYVLVSTADYAGRLIESDETNNAAEVKVRIRGNSVTTVG